MSRSPALILLACFLPTGDDGPKATEPPRDIYRVWIHSAEEDTDEVQVYRPKGYPFPPARGRDGFEIKETGVFVAHEIAPADGMDKIEGRWECKGRDVLSVTFPAARPRALIPGEELPPPAPRSLRILSCNAKVLRISKPRPGKAGA